jgi:hypothetical protein
MMMTFWEWLGQGYEFGFVERLLREMRGDQGYQAFIEETDREFRTWIGTILRMGKFTDPRDEAEARAIVADANYFNYAQELLAAASGGRARLRGQDVLVGVTRGRTRGAGGCPRPPWPPARTTCGRAGAS